MEQHCLALVAAMCSLHWTCLPALLVLCVWRLHIGGLQHTLRKCPGRLICQTAVGGQLGVVAGSCQFSTVISCPSLSGFHWHQQVEVLKSNPQYVQQQEGLRQQLVMQPCHWAGKLLFGCMFGLMVLSGLLGVTLGQFWYLWIHLWRLPKAKPFCVRVRATYQPVVWGLLGVFNVSIWSPVVEAGGRNPLLLAAVMTGCVAAFVVLSQAWLKLLSDVKKYLQTTLWRRQCLHHAFMMCSRVRGMSSYSGLCSLPDFGSLQALIATWDRHTSILKNR